MEYYKTTLEAIEKAPLPRLIQLRVVAGDVMGVFKKPRTALPYHILEYQKVLQGKCTRTCFILLKHMDESEKCALLVLQTVSVTLCTVK